MKVITESHYCDRCAKPIKRESATLVENMSFQMSTYDPRGSGGGRRDHLEFCAGCSQEFLAWVDSKPLDVRTK